MKKTPEFLPEARNPLTFLDPLIDPECYIGKVVSCSVRSYDYSANEMEVFIGNSFYGIIPLSELSIYDLGDADYKSLAPFFAGSRLLTAEIIGYFSDTKRFLLSRKKNMENFVAFASTLYCKILVGALIIELVVIWLCKKKINKKDKITTALSVGLVALALAICFPIYSMEKTQIFLCGA